MPFGVLKICAIAVLLPLQFVGEITGETLRNAIHTVPCISKWDGNRAYKFLTEKASY